MQTAVTIEQALQSVFDGAREGLAEEISPTEYDRRRRDFVFHLRDCKTDFEQLAHFFNHPEKYDEDAASRLLIGALYHIVPHLNNAGKLLLDEIVDPFAADHVA